MTDESFSKSSRMKDYLNHKPAAMLLVTKIKQYWYERGLLPEVKLLEVPEANGKVRYDIRSNIFSSDVKKVKDLPNK